MDGWMEDRVGICMYKLGSGCEWAKLHIVTFYKRRLVG